MRKLFILAFCLLLLPIAVKAQPNQNFSLIPAVSNSFDIGSDTRWWRNLHVGRTNWIGTNRYVFPLGHGSAGFVLTNDGTGLLGWGQGSTGGVASFSDLVWTNNGAVIYTLIQSNRLQLTTNSIYGVAIQALQTNTALGFGALSNNSGTFSSNVAIGAYAMQIGPDAYNDVAIGHGALRMDTAAGGENVAVGFMAMASNTIGYFNTAVGEYALQRHTNGFRNTAIGYSAGISNWSGFENTLIGALAGYKLTNGDFNTYVGVGAGELSQTNSWNTALGYGTLPFLTTGTNNIAVGARAGGSLVPTFTNGVNNTFFGANSTVDASLVTALTNSTALGYTSVITKSFQMVFGNGVSNYQFRGVDYVFPAAQGASGAILTNNGSGTLGWGAVPGSTLGGTTNFINLSSQAAKLPTTNYPGIDASWQDWEIVYYETNAEGIRTNLNASWQFITPQDYATNSFKVRIQSILVSTNGPNTSNTIFGVSVLRATSGDSTDLHTGAFTSVVWGTNTWAASPSNTNKMQSILINMGTTSALAPGDLCILKIVRDAFNDTFGGATSIVGVQGEYTRP